MEKLNIVTKADKNVFGIFPHVGIEEAGVDTHHHGVDNKSKEKSEKRASWGKIYIFAGEKGEKTCRTANWRNLS